jgi:hypothetical protein
VLDSSLLPSRRIAHCMGFPLSGVTTLPSLIGLTAESLTPFNVGSTFWVYFVVMNIELSPQSCGERREYSMDKHVVREPLNQELHVMRSNRPLLARAISARTKADELSRSKKRSCRCKCHAKAIVGHAAGEMCDDVRLSSRRRQALFLRSTFGEFEDGVCPSIAYQVGRRSARHGLSARPASLRPRY